VGTASKPYIDTSKRLMVDTPMRAASQTRPSKSANAHSCVRCFKRKVKCDKERPCGSCTRHNAECVLRVPNPPRLRKERPPEDVLIRRIEHYKGLLRQSGVVGLDSQVVPDQGQENTTNSAPIESSQLPISTPTTGLERQFTKSQLVYKDGESKYLDKCVRLSDI
jgi:Fungal Zn(2)-Cys(6) binuclear cluster domain